jgi:F-type H+-transporting ATPase subunit gamma
MPIPTRLLKRRIKSIGGTRKIMRAMELVASSKMRRAVQMTLASRPYTALSVQIAKEIRHYVHTARHFLLAPRVSEGPALLLVVASDRGLCGGFNQQVARQAITFVRERGISSVRAVVVGRRAEQSLRREGVEIIASFPSLSNAPSFERATPIAKLSVEEFLQGRVTSVWVAYTHFQSALSYTAQVEQVLPIMEKEIAPLEDEEEDDEPKLLMEPTPDEVLKKLLPRMVDMKLYQAVLESAASEHSARMVAMRNAKESAGEMLEDLTFTLNQARQSAITQEISEISAGKAALE